LTTNNSNFFDPKAEKTNVVEATNVSYYTNAQKEGVQYEDKEETNVEEESQ